ncbi:hypothetical protein V8E36_005433 [Tilletia maclaganii]
MAYNMSASSSSSIANQQRPFSSMRQPLQPLTAPAQSEAERQSASAQLDAAALGLLQLHAQRPEPAAATPLTASLKRRLNGSEAARDIRQAKRARNSDSVLLSRTDVVAVLRAALGRPDLEPKQWQLEAAFRLLQGADGIIAAGTGSGKSLIWWTAALASPTAAFVVLEPITSLAVEQVRSSPVLVIYVFENAAKLQAAGIGAVAINADTVRDGSGAQQPDADALAAVKAGRVRFVFISPEMLLLNGAVSHAVCEGSFSKRVAGIIFDEAHIVYDWGIKPSKNNGAAFRLEYGKAAMIRARFTAAVPVLAALRHSVKPMLGLAEVLPANVAQIENIPKTLIYVNTRSEARRGVQSLRRLLPRRLHAAVQRITGDDSARRSQEMLEKMRQGAVRIIVCTEALGMGVDLPCIDLVVQWRLPRDFKDLVQHFGRGARGHGTKAQALLLYDEWVKRASQGEPLSASLQERWLKIDPLLRQWLSTKTCKRRTMDDLLALDFDALATSLGQTSKAAISADLAKLCQNRPEIFMWRRPSAYFNDGGDTNAQACCAPCGAPFQPQPMQRLPEPKAATSIHLQAPPPSVHTNALRQNLGERLLDWRQLRHETEGRAQYVQEQAVMADGVLCALADRAPRILARRLNKAPFDVKLLEMLLGPASGLSSTRYASLISLLGEWAADHVHDPVAKLLTFEGYMPRGQALSSRLQAATSRGEASTSRSQASTSQQEELRPTI